MTPAPGRRGRRTEPGPAAVLRTARDLLAQTGYAGTTLTAVALRAGAGRSGVHRRWWSRAELVLDALAEEASPTVPDTGSLAGDLHVLQVLTSQQQLWRTLPHLVADLEDSPELTAAVRERLVRPYAHLVRSLLERAVARGELTSTTDLDLLAGVPVAMVGYRLLVTREPLDAEFLGTVLDQVLLTLAGARAVTGCGCAS